MTDEGPAPDTETVAAADAGKVQALINYANSRLAVGDRADALGQLELAVEVYGPSPDATLALVGLWRQTGEFERARDLVNLAIETETAPNAGLYKALAALEKDLGRTGDAILALSEAVVIDPIDDVAINTLGQFLMEIGRVDEAAACFGDAANLAQEGGGSNQIDYLMNLAHAFIELGRHEPAEEIYRAIIEAAPLRADAYLNLAGMLTNTARYDEAEAMVDQAMALGFDHARFHLVRGTIHFRRRDWPKAEASLAKVVDLNPSDDYARHLLNAIRGRTSEAAPTAYLTQVFDDYAGRFEDHLINQLHYKAPGLILGLVDRLRPGRQFDAILDLGCGTGLMGITLFDRTEYLKGIDISAKMIDQARAKQIYRELVVADLLDVLKTDARAYDLIVAADVFTYIGNLRPTLEAAKARLAPDGLMVFSAEAMTEGREDDYALSETGRYLHRRGHLETLAGETGYRIVEIVDTTLRLQDDQPVNGYVVALERAD